MASEKWLKEETGQVVAFDLKHKWRNKINVCLGLETAAWRETMHSHTNLEEIPKTGIINANNYSNITLYVCYFICFAVVII